MDKSQRKFQEENYEKGVITSPITLLFLNNTIVP